MGNTIKIDQLAAEIMKGLTEYADMATDDMKAAVKKACTSVKKDIQSAIRNSGTYSRCCIHRT